MHSWSLELRSLQNGAIFSSSTRPKHEITNSGDEKELISGNLHAQTKMHLNTVLLKLNCNSSKGQIRCCFYYEVFA